VWYSVGLTHTARGNIKSVQAYAMNLLGKSNGNLKKRKSFLYKNFYINYLLYSTKYIPVYKGAYVH